MFHKEFEVCVGTVQDILNSCGLTRCCKQPQVNTDQNNAVGNEIPSQGLLVDVEWVRFVEGLR